MKLRISNTITAEYFLAITYLFTIMVSNISSYTLDSFALKIISAVIMFASFFYYVVITKVNLKDFHNSNEFRKTYTLLAAIIIYLLLTLIYSPNPFFGFLKILNLLISLYPLVYVSLFILRIDYTSLIEKFTYLIILTAIASGIYIVIKYPFDFSTVYSFSPRRWSHVIYGRFICLASLICFLNMLSEDVQAKKRIFGLLSFLFLLLTLYTGYRMGLIALAIIYFLFFMEICCRHNLKNTAIIFLSLFVSAFAILALFPNFIPERYNDLFTYSGGIGTRIQAWNLSLQVFCKNIFTGIGFGGFNNILFGSTIGTNIKYPHNIILEAFCELGLVGGAGLLFLVYKILWAGFRYNLSVLYFLIYAFLISLTGKDLTTNNLFFIGIAFLFIKKD